MFQLAVISLLIVIAIAAAYGAFFAFAAAKLSKYHHENLDRLQVELDNLRTVNEYLHAKLRAIIGNEDVPEFPKLRQWIPPSD